MRLSAAQFRPELVWGDDVRDEFASRKIFDVDGITFRAVVVDGEKQ